MNRKLLTIILAGTFFTTALLPSLSSAGNGKMGGQGSRNQTKSALTAQGRQKLHDGSCLISDGASRAGAMKKKGNIYGPGDGTGNQDDGPQDETGNGAPANR